VMSQLHAQYLRDEGFMNISVYRPGSGATTKPARKKEIV
jgi:hypothetical protein